MGKFGPFLAWDIHPGFGGKIDSNKANPLDISGTIFGAQHRYFFGFIQA